jgi:xanthine dehydrogenase YagR molybdenum-binding subunit
MPSVSITTARTMFRQHSQTIAGGIGMALMEHSVVDGRNGRVVNANFAEYAVPVHLDAPPVMEVIFADEHDPHVNPLSVKGVGEIAMVASPRRSCSAFLARRRNVQMHPELKA